MQKEATEETEQPWWKNQQGNVGSDSQAVDKLNYESNKAVSWEMVEEKAQLSAY